MTKTPAHDILDRLIQQRLLVIDGAMGSCS
jgi:methionine synthase I (cobalamin-dependent)